MFRFAGGEPWDWTVPGRLYNLIQGEFPLRRDESRTTKEAEETEESEDTADFEDEDVRILEPKPIRFHSQDERRNVLVGPNVLSINHLKPYSGWEVLKADIQQVLDCYWKEAKPGAIKGMALTYINSFPLPQVSMHYDEFLNVHPTLPIGRRDLPWVNWFQSVDIRKKELNSILSIMAGTEVQDSKLHLFLNLSMAHYREIALTKDEVDGWLESAHLEIETTLRDSLTDLSKQTVGYKENLDESYI